MKKALYLSLVAMMLANVGVQNAYGSVETYSVTDSKSQRFQDALSSLKESCMQHQPSLTEGLDGWMKAAYENLPSDRRDEFIDLLERASRVSSDRAWKEFENEIGVIDNGSYSSEDVALLSLRMFFRHDQWAFEKNVSSLDLLLPIIQLRASIAPTDEFPLSFISLHFTGCNLGDAGIAQIAPLLCANCILRLSIDGDHSITINGWQTFVNALKQNSSLIHLYIHHCIGDDEVAMIADSYKRDDSSLERLSLISNHITDTGAITLADCLTLNNSMTELNLRGNFITEIGAKAIFDVLNSGQNITLTTVKLPDGLEDYPFENGNSIASLLRRAVSAVVSVGRSVGSAGYRALSSAGRAVASAGRSVGSAGYRALSRAGSAVASAGRSVGSAIANRTGFRRTRPEEASFADVEESMLDGVTPVAGTEASANTSATGAKTSGAPTQKRARTEPEDDDDSEDESE